MENISTRFVQKLYDMSRTQLPSRITEKARECFTDYLSVAIGGCNAYSGINRIFIEKNRIKGENHIIGSSQTADVSTAVMVNAFNAHVLELDDSHRVAMTHLGAPIFSALMGTAEIYGSTLNSLLHGAVVGYEAAIRLANAIQPSHKKRGFHVSGTCCTVGSAMGIAAMLGYSKEEMSNVLSASATSAAGLLAVISGASEQKPYNIANAAAAGVNAALYGKLFNGAVDILGDSRGFLRAMSDCYDADRLFEDGYAIETIYQKLYAACRHCHAPMEAMLIMKSKTDFSDGDVESIEVKTYDLAINGHDHTEITGISSAKQSIPFGVASACLYQNCGMEAFTADKVTDERLLDLTKKVKVIEDPALTALVPGKRAAVVTVKLKDGSGFSQRVDFPKGEPENPITKAEFSEKFYALAESGNWDKQAVSNILEFVNTSGEKPAGDLFRWL